MYPNQIKLVMRMLDICLTHIMADLKQAICLHVVEQLSRGDL
jgi:hypothetical protein